MNPVDDKTAIVTGGGSGIGAASCVLLAQAGAQVVVSDINLKAAEKTAQIITASGGEAMAVQHDVASETVWDRVVEATMTRYGKLDVLVNNAGIVVPKASKATSRADLLCMNTSLEDWRTVQSINYDGVFLGMSRAMQVMAKKEITASIINIASVGGLLYGSSTVPYMASKGGVRMLSKAAAIECKEAGLNIRVNSIYPGAIDTSMNVPISDGQKNEMKRNFRMADAIDIARGVLFLASDDSRFMTGSELVIDGGQSASMFNLRST